MKAFQGNIELKKFVLKELAAHKKADEIVKGTYGDNGQGCAVGCTIHATAKFLGVTHDQSDHVWLSKQFDMPEFMAHLIDKIFEELPKAKSLAWPGSIIKAIPTGADLSLVPAQFLGWAFGPILTDTLPDSDCKSAVIAVANTFEREGRGEFVSQKEKDKAAWAARAARAGLAALAAWAACDARDATRAAWAAWDARDTWDAWDAFTLQAADKLIELVSLAPVGELAAK